MYQADIEIRINPTVDVQDGILEKIGFENRSRERQKGGKKFGEMSFEER